MEEGVGLDCETESEFVCFFYITVETIVRHGGDKHETQTAHLTFVNICRVFRLTCFQWIEGDTPVSDRDTETVGSLCAIDLHGPAIVSVGVGDDIDHDLFKHQIELVSQGVGKPFLPGSGQDEIPDATQVAQFGCDGKGTHEC